ncbi:MAG: hypothetical protein U0414_06965 [Polyangiaceae bacterium]
MSESESPRLIHPIGRAQRFWMRTMPWLFAPRDGRGSLFTRAMGMVLVVPLTILTPLSLTYQAYLNRIFHRSITARVGHAALIPVTTWLVMLACASLVGPRPVTHTLDAGNVFLFNGAAIVAIVLAVYYAVWAILERDVLWGATLVALVFGMWVGANVQFTLTHADAPDAPFYAAWRTPHNPWMWMAITSLGQALSHLREPDLPPRLNGTPDWVPLRAYFLGPLSRSDHPATRQSCLGRCARMVSHFFFGPLDEWIASPRLLPVYVLEALWGLGHRRDRREAIRALAARSLERGNPALDFIGTGGGRFLESP